MDTELIDQKWVLGLPVADNYTAREAAWILGASVGWIRTREGLMGPASTPIRPVDHDALVRFVLVRARKRKRVKARAELKLVLEKHLGE